MTPTPTAITWTSLLAHWTTIVQASTVLPSNAEGDRWRSAVPHVITLQAVTHALADLDRAIDQAERAVGQDKAEMLIRDSAAKCHALWRGEALPSEVEAMIDDARAALSVTWLSGTEWRLAPKSRDSAANSFDHPSDLISALLSLDFDGDLFVPAPGIVFMTGSPVAFVRGRHGGEPAPRIQATVSKYLAQNQRVEAARQPCFRQVYRQFDFGTGRVARDLVVHETSELAAGQPLLVPAVSQGREMPVPMAPPPGSIDRVSEVSVVIADPTN